MDDQPVEVSKLEEWIDAYEQESLKLPKIEQNIEYPRVLYESISEIKKKDLNELTFDLIEVSRYQLYLRRKLNREKGWRRWAKQRLDELTAYNIVNVSTEYGYSQREMVARFHCNKTIALNKFIRKLDLKISALEGIPEQISQLADTIKDVKYYLIHKHKEAKEDG